jgi:hypothetical protein
MNAGDRVDLALYVGERSAAEGGGGVLGVGWSSWEEEEEGW